MWIIVVFFQLLIGFLIGYGFVWALDFQDTTELIVFLTGAVAGVWTVGVIFRDVQKAQKLSILLSIFLNTLFGAIIGFYYIQIIKKLK